MYKRQPSEVARKIKQIEAEDPNLKGRKIFRVGDPAIWGSQGPESIGALMERERVYLSLIHLQMCIRDSR